jgi:hypothetical protein
MELSKADLNMAIKAVDDRLADYCENVQDEYEAPADEENSKYFYWHGYSDDLSKGLEILQAIQNGEEVKVI